MGINIIFIWIRGHSNILGNGKANQVKNAADFIDTPL